MNTKIIIGVLAVLIILAMVLTVSYLYPIKSPISSEVDEISTFTVNSSNPVAGDDNPGTPEQPFATIQAAVDNAGPGDIIYVAGGTYYETILVRISGTQEDPITISAYPGDKVTIASTSYACFDLQQVKNVIINGFELTGGYGGEGTTVAHGGGIRAFPDVYSEDPFGARDCVFVNNIIHDNDGGIWTVYSHSNVIKHNIIYNSSEAAIRIKRGHHNVIRNNLIYNNGIKEPWGICIYGSIGTEIFHNTIYEETGGAIYIYEGTSNLNGATPGSEEYAMPCKNTHVYNNIGVVQSAGREGAFFGAPLVIGSSTLPDRDQLLTEIYGDINNQYYNNLWYHPDNPDAIVSWGCHGEEIQTYLPLTEFQQKYEGYGKNSLATDPLFVDPVNLDFTLQSDSLAKNAASDGTDIGVNFDDLPSIG